MLAANFWVVCMNISYKYSWRFGSTLLVTLIARNIGQFGINYVIMQFKNPKLKFSDLSGDVINLGLVRGMLSTLTSLFSTWSVMYLDYTENQLIALTKPFLTMALNKLIFKEKILPIHILSGIMAFVGLIFIVQPPFIFSDGQYMLTSDKLKGVLYKLIANIWNSLADLSIKNIGGKLDTHFIIHYMGIINVFCFSLPFILLEIPRIESLPCYFSLFMVGLFSFAVHLYYSKAYQFGKTNLIAVIEFSSILFSLVADYFLLGRTYNLYDYLGTAILMIALYLVVAYK